MAKRKEGLDLSTLEMNVDGLYQCPKCGNYFHRNGISNHMNWCSGETSDDKGQPTAPELKVNYPERKIQEGLATAPPSGAPHERLAGILKDMGLTNKISSTVSLFRSGDIDNEIWLNYCLKLMQIDGPNRALVMSTYYGRPMLQLVKDDPQYVDRSVPGNADIAKLGKLAREEPDAYAQIMDEMAKQMKMLGMMNMQRAMTAVYSMREEEMHHDHHGNMGGQLPSMQPPGGEDNIDRDMDKLWRERIKSMRMKQLENEIHDNSETPQTQPLTPPPVEGNKIKVQAVNPLTGEPVLDPMFQPIVLELTPEQYMARDMQIMRMHQNMTKNEEQPSPKENEMILRLTRLEERNKRLEEENRRISVDRMRPQGPPPEDPRVKALIEQNRMLQDQIRASEAKREKAEERAYIDARFARLENQITHGLKGNRSEESELSTYRKGVNDAMSQVRAQTTDRRFAAEEAREQRKNDLLNQGIRTADKRGTAIDRKTDFVLKRGFDLLKEWSSQRGRPEVAGYTEEELQNYYTELSEEERIEIDRLARLEAEAEEAGLTRNDIHPEIDTPPKPEEAPDEGESDQSE